MNRPAVVLALPGAQALATGLAARLDADAADVQVHDFPDGEHRVRVQAPVAGRDVVVAAHLDRPDAKALPLLFTLDLVRELGAARVLLAAPYLPYMRQDHRFQPGEAVSSASFAAWLASRLDGLVTVEPHLHRWPSLGAIFRIPTQAASAAEPMAAWLRAQVARPVLVGPDEESEQWVGRVAAVLDAPHAVLRKQRSGDREVRIEGLDTSAFAGREPVLLDDMVSTGGTVLAAAAMLRAAGTPARLCICAHALFDDEAAARLASAGLRVASCGTVLHASNAIDVTPAIADGLAALGLPCRMP
jgi:ribose-phosphate pyrophosphokinase